MSVYFNCKNTKFFWNGKKNLLPRAIPLSDGLFLFGLLGGDGQFVIYGCAVWGKGCGFVAACVSPLAVAVGAR